MISGAGEVGKGRRSIVQVENSGRSVNKMKLFGRSKCEQVSEEARACEKLTASIYSLRISKLEKVVSGNQRGHT